MEVQAIQQVPKVEVSAGSKKALFSLNCKHCSDMYLQLLLSNWLFHLQAQYFGPNQSRIAKSPGSFSFPAWP